MMALKGCFTQGTQAPKNSRCRARYKGGRLWWQRLMLGGHRLVYDFSDSLSDAGAVRAEHVDRVTFLSPELARNMVMRSGSSSHQQALLPPSGRPVCERQRAAG